MAFTAYRRLSGSEEPRGNVDLNLRWEIFKDFFWGVSVYYTYDGQAENEEEASTTVRSPRWGGSSDTACRRTTVSSADGPLDARFAQAWHSSAASLGKTKERSMAKKPNILVLWGDDIGYWNVSAYNQGMMGYKTPNIDSIAKDGALFTDWYGQQSCTAGRACFITGQSGFRTGHAQGRPAGREGRAAGTRRHDRRAAEGAGLHDGAVRQEPPGRRRRDAADRARLRRVLRLALSPQRRGRVRERGLLQRSRADQEISDARRAFTAGRIRTARRRSKARGRSARSAWRPSTTRSPTPRSTISRRRRRPTSRSSCGGTPRACTSTRT